MITSGPRAIATARLASAGLPRPATLITAEDVAAGKPEPDPYLLGARRLGRAPEKCAVFEDAPAGITAARAAGVTTVIGIGRRAHTFDVTIAVADLRGIGYDGTRVTIPR